MKLPWVPTLILVLGAVLTLGAAEQNTLPLRRPLGEVVPMEVQGHLGQDLTVPDDEAAVAGFSNYLFRLYEKAEPGQTDLDPPAADPEAVSPQGDSTTVGIEPPSSSFSLYVGYYESQTQGNTIHSPKNCLPGAGWEPLSSEPVAIEVGGRAVTVNKYLLKNDSQQALVLYWYQGRGRVVHDEYRVKLALLRDAAIRRRSDEALVRIVVPVLEGGTEAALELALDAARVAIPALDLSFPEG